MRKALIPIILLLAAFPAPAAAAPQTQGTPSEVIALINDYRASNGLPAYQQNSILSQIAQGQADWLASQVSTSDIHEGPGGSRPRDRAYAAGYGGGQQIFISEIAKYGVNESASSAVSWWKTSQIHNNTMLASTYVEAGCGVATDGNSRYYYVCAMGYIVGGDYTSGSSSNPEPQQPAAPVMIPVTIADPRPDGSVVHIIRQGQTLWTLAAIYEVPLAQILELNGYVAAADGSVNVVIQPGDEIMVKPAGSMPTLTPTADTNATSTAKATKPPSPTPEPTQQLIAAASTPAAPTSQPAAVAQLNPEAEARAANTTVYLVVGVALLCIVGVFAASFFVQRPRKPEPPDNDPFAPIE